MILASFLETRQSLNSNSMRWSGRRGTQQQLQREWVPPDITHRTRPLSVMSHYSDPNYVIGNSTAKGLERIARLFKFGDDGDLIRSDSLTELPADGRTTSRGSPVLCAKFQPSMAELADNQDIAELP